MPRIKFNSDDNFPSKTTVPDMVASLRIPAIEDGLSIYLIAFLRDISFLSDLRLSRDRIFSSSDGRSRRETRDSTLISREHLLFRTNLIGRRECTVPGS